MRNLEILRHRAGSDAVQSSSPLRAFGSLGAAIIRAVRKSLPPRLVPRLRVMKGDDVLLGPGKADLLDGIESHGSLREAAGALGMSYMRAWKLVKAMNDGFREPLVLFRRGGPARGGAELTEAGRAALRLYRLMESESLRASQRGWKQLLKLVR